MKRHKLYVKVGDLRYMSNYVNEFNIAALLLLCFLTLTFSLKQIFPNEKNRLYRVMLILTLVSTLFETLCCFIPITNGKIPVGICYLIQLIYLISYSSIFIAFYLYTLEVVQLELRTFFSKFTVRLSIALYIILILLTAFTHLIFYFESKSVFHRGPFYFMWFILALSLLLQSLIILYRYEKKHNYLFLFSVYFMLVTTIISIVVQYFYPKLHISNLSITIFLFFLYFTLNASESYIDKHLNCYSNKAFIEQVHIFEKKQETFSVVTLEVEEYGYIEQVLGIATLDAVTRKIQSFLIQTFGRQNIYALYGIGYALFVKQDQQEIDHVIHIIKEHFKTPYDIGIRQEVLTPMFCVVKDSSFALDGMQIIDEIGRSFNEMQKNEMNLITYADGRYLAKAQREQHVIHAIKQAMKKDTFEVYYQPIYDTSCSQIRSLEALLRLKDDKLGFIPPDEFIILAEKNGMIIDISSIAFRKVCAFIHDYNIKDLGIDYIEYNLSIVECDDNKLASNLLSIMKEYGVSPSQINFEITETAQAHNPTELMQNMNALIQAGSTFSMDDYGTGYSTTQYLISLPLHIVKIDKSILWPAMKDEKSLNVLRQLVSTLKSIEKEIVVEGVETIEMVNLLKQLDCDYLQGFYYSKPIPAEEIVTYLKDIKSN